MMKKYWNYFLDKLVEYPYVFIPIIDAIGIYIALALYYGFDLNNWLLYHWLGFLITWIFIAGISCLILE